MAIGMITEEGFRAAVENDDVFFSDEKGKCRVLWPLSDWDALNEYVQKAKAQREAEPQEA